MIGFNEIANSNEGKIIVLKATSDTGNYVLKNSCFATATKPRSKIKGFVVIGKADVFEPRVYAIGTIKQISSISSTSNARKVFKNNFHGCWRCEYSLNILLNLTKSPYNFVTISDVFNTGDVKKVLKAEQFVYVDSLRGIYNRMISQPITVSNTTGLSKGIV